VEHGSDLAANDLDAGLGADGQMTARNPRWPGSVADLGLFWISTWLTDTAAGGKIAVVLALDEFSMALDLASSGAITLLECVEEGAMNVLTNLIHAGTNLDLATIAVASRTKPVWYEAWAKLTTESTEEERLAVYQAVRDSGSLPAEAGFRLVFLQVEQMALEDRNVRLVNLEDQLTTIEKAHGLAIGEPWSTGEPPKEYQELKLACQVAWDDVFVAKLEEFGEYDMAQQVRTDPAGVDDRNSRGREFFDGP